MPRGSRPGERRGGRKTGTPNKITADVKELARKYGPEVIAGFARLFREADSDAARIAAGKELLDRGYGKAAQPLGGGADGTEAIKHVFGWLPSDTS